MMNRKSGLAAVSVARRLAPNRLDCMGANAACSFG